MVIRDRHPRFLVETLFRRGVSSVVLDEMTGTGDLLSAFDVDDIATEAPLFPEGRRWRS